MEPLTKIKNDKTARYGRANGPTRARRETVRSNAHNRRKHFVKEPSLFKQGNSHGRTESSRVKRYKCRTIGRARFKVIQLSSNNNYYIIERKRVFSVGGGWLFYFTLITKLHYTLVYIGPFKSFKWLFIDF